DTLLLSQPNRVGPTRDFPVIEHALDDITLLDVMTLPLIEKARDKAESILFWRRDAKFVAFFGEAVAAQDALRGIVKQRAIVVVYVVPGQHVVEIGIVGVIRVAGVGATHECAGI